jgi:hypothetical protein
MQITNKQLRRIIKEELDAVLSETGEGFVFQGKRPNYSSIILNDNSARLLEDEAKTLQDNQEIPSDYKSQEGKWPHHMTINMGPLFPDWIDGDEYTLKINGYGFVDSVNEKGKKVRAMAFRVDPASFGNLQIKNKTAHITAMVPPDGKAFHSNEITDYKDINLSVTGNVVEAGKVEKKKKQPKKQKKQGQNPVEFAKSLAARNLPADQIKNIIMKKFNKPEQAALGIMRGAGIQ